jgi:hypothetical protein
MSMTGLLLEEPGEGVGVAVVDGLPHGTVVGRSPDDLGGGLDGGGQSRPTGIAVFEGDDELCSRAWEGGGDDL